MAVKIKDVYLNNQAQGVESVYMSSESDHPYDAEIETKDGDIIRIGTDLLDEIIVKYADRFPDLSVWGNVAEIVKDYQ